MSISADQFFDLPDSVLYRKFFCHDQFPVAWLDNIADAVAMLSGSQEIMLRSDYPVGCVIDDSVFIHKTAKLPPVCVIQGPTYIGAHAEIRPFAYLRGNVVIGKNCMIGNSTEIKNAILLDHVQVPHFNYVGDSILGNHVHLGAGVILANLRLDQADIKISINGEKIETGRRKFGAILGDYVEIGCNSVLNPGCIIAKNRKFAPLSSLSGYIESK